MRRGLAKVHIGLRTIKTTVAIVISMVIVDYLGASASKLIFAMLGAMAAVQPTFKDSLDSCYAQIVGVLFGAAASTLSLRGSMFRFIVVSSCFIGDDVDFSIR